MQILKIHHADNFDKERLLNVLYDILTVDSYNSGGDFSNNSADNNTNGDKDS